MIDELEHLKTLFSTMKKQEETRLSLFKRNVPNKSYEVIHPELKEFNLEGVEVKMWYYKKKKKIYNKTKDKLKELNQNILINWEESWIRK